MIDTLIADFTDLRLWLVVIFLSAVGLASKLAIYRAGKFSADSDLSGFPGYSPERRARLDRMFEMRGSIVLLLASIPGVGALTAAVAGNIGVSQAAFVFWVSISNITRNWLIVLFTGQLTSLF